MGKRKKIVAIALIVLGSIIFVLLGGLIIFCTVETYAVNTDFDQNDYSDVMKRGLGESDPRVVDIAMLGAHDAFSYEISRKSVGDPHELDKNVLLGNKFTKGLAGAFMARLLKTQYSDAYTMLKKGVRYFDVRVTQFDGGWYTKHALVSGELKGYITDVIRFLQENPTEFVVFDIQHATLGDKDYTDLYEFVRSVQVNGECLFDFVPYRTDVTPLGELTYRTVTDNQQKGGAVVLMKMEVSETYAKHYTYEQSMRSQWHDKQRTKDILPYIQAERDFLLENDQYEDMFRVNQAQLTGMGSGVADYLRATFQWSLLNISEKHNEALLNAEGMRSWFLAMPILMVDFSNSVQGDFNNQINAAIVASNSMRFNSTVT